MEDNSTGNGAECECCTQRTVDIAIDGAELAKQQGTDPKETVDIDIYVTTLNAPAAPGLHVVREMGLVSATYTRAKQKLHTINVKQWVVENALEAESARALAIASLRTKAKQAGANAVLGIKLDLEGDSLGAMSYTLVTASGTAVVLADSSGATDLVPVEAVVIAQDATQCLYAGAYAPVATVMARA